MRIFMHIFPVALLLFVFPATAEVPLELTGYATEGGLMFGQTDPDAKVVLDGKSVRVSKSGAFLIGFGRDAVGTKKLQISHAGETRIETINVENRDFKIERIDGLPKKKVTPDPKSLARIRKEKAEISAARKTTDATPHYLSGFSWPATGRLSGVYGSQRILNGQPRRPHYGTDIAAPEGTPVGAVTAGRVAFVHDGMFFNGKTVLIDHGLGLRSVYIHLSKTNVKAGQMVKIGEQIGAIGKTGRATGPHLHFGLTLDQTPIDAEVVLGPMPPAQ